MYHKCITINYYNETPTYHETASMNILKLKAFQLFLRKYTEIR